MGLMTGLVAASCLVIALGQRPPAAASAGNAPVVCPRCGWKAPAAGRHLSVANVDQLERALTTIKPGDTVLLSEGNYPLRRMLDIAVPDVTIRGRSGNAARVVLHGRGMTGDPVGVALSVSAPGVTIADLTVRDVGYHAVQVRGETGASRFTLHNARLRDTGQQLLKGSAATEGRFADDGLVACSEFSYSDSAPSDYTNGVDLLATKGWVIRDNRFTRIRGPESGGWAAGPSVLVWAASEDTLVERNLVVDSFRGIALGLGAGASSAARGGVQAYDHLRGIIRNNVVVNLNSWGDEAIEANAAQDVRIEHNTVLVEGVRSPWSIGIRFRSTSATVRNNLTNQQVWLRNGGRAVSEGNVAGATRAWFVDAPSADLRLSPGGARAVDAGVPIPGLTQDFGRGARQVGAAPDAGAHEMPARRAGAPR